jgi:hypothetical protein
MSKETDNTQDTESDIESLEPKPCKFFTDDEIRALYPSARVTRRVMSAQEKNMRYLRNIALMAAASKKKSRRFIYGD